MSESSSPAWIAADVENGHIVYRGCWEGEAETLTPETIEEAPISERLRDILEWAFERTTTVHVRVDWSGEY